MIAILFFSNRMVAQQEKILEYNTFVQWVATNHPLARQAALTAQIGSASVTAARGFFDPIAYATVNHKTYNELNYYQREMAGVDIPTYGGVSFHGSFERNSGQYLNPEKTVPTGGLATVGARLNILQGLMIDQRRLALWQAKAFERQSIEEQRIALNNLYQDAANVYWEWALSVENYRVLEQGLAVSMQRFVGIRSSFLQGELPAIDTVEAYGQLQNISNQLKDQEARMYSLRQLASTFTWSDEGAPMDIDGATFPQPMRNIDPQLFTEELLASIPDHPLLKSLDQEREILDLERRWKTEQLKPTLFVQYNFLGASVGEFEQHGFFENNYTLGGGFSIPLFLRRERGNLRITKAKLEQVELDIANTKAQLTANLRGEINQLRINTEQLTINAENVRALERLLSGEVQRFDIGESSIFLINNRENALLQGQITQNRVRAQWLITRAKVLNAAGKAWEELIEAD
ncbi:MAG: TolC family protein [Cryomorphaceae bacterium]|nr:TolC family protein [Cryomorphaceae bacterium]